MPTNVIIQNHSRKIRNPIPHKYVETTCSHSVYLVNLTEQTWICQRTYGAYSILGRKDDQEYTSCEISGRLETMDEGDSKYGQQMTEAEDIAADIANECNSGILVPEHGDSFMGVFVSETLIPKPSLLTAMTKRLNEFYDGQIRLADQFWDDPRDHKNISSLMRRAAKHRNQTRPWTYEAVSMSACPACGVNIKSGVAICATCRAIIDEAKARKFFPERFESNESEPKPARSRKPAQTPAA